MYIVWYEMHNSGLLYGMKFDKLDEAEYFAHWMEQIPKIYSNISIERK